MATLCPYCKDDLRIEMTAQFVEHIDPSMMEIYSEELQRTQKRAAALGGMHGRMMKMAAGMAKGMERTMFQMAKSREEYPPMVTVLRCINCKTALSLKLPSSVSAD
jgi:hypothetical protein